MNQHTSVQFNVLHLVAFVLIVFAVRLLLIDAYASTVPYWDDWGVGFSTVHKYAVGDLTFAEMFLAANEHIFLFSKFLNIFLFDLNSNQWDTLLVVVANSFLASCTAALLFNIVRQSADELNAWTVAIFLLIFWALPVSLDSILWAMQTHTYFMMLFVVAGLWYSLDTPFSLKWWIGIICISCAPLTLSGGTFASISLIATLLFGMLVSNAEWRKTAITMAFSSVAAIAGTIHILSQTGKSSTFRPDTFVDGAASFLRTMSWPLPHDLWPAIFLNAPMLVLLALLLIRRQALTRIQVFAIALFGFGVITAVAIAYARGVDGMGPARRYLEFLTLTSLANVMALSNLLTQFSNNSQRLLSAILFTWLLVFISSFPDQAHRVNYTTEDRLSLKTPQFFNVRDYLVTGEIRQLKNKGFRHIPFHNADYLAIILDKMSETDMLRYDLQVSPPPMNLGYQDTFVVNGTLAPSRRPNFLDYNREPVVGSYVRGGEVSGEIKTGTYESPPISTNRPYIMIPVTGHLGQEGTSLRLKELGTGNYTDVKPGSVSEEHSDVWRPIWIETPDKAFQIVAEDYSTEYWFGFAMPRTVGKLTYYSEGLLSKADDLLKLAFLLLLIGIFPMLKLSFRASSANSERIS